MHEAIVSKEEFELAQAVIRGGEKKPERNQKLYPLKGLVCCGNCKRAMTRRKLKNGSVYYQCHHSTHDRDTECPVGEKYSEITLEAAAYNAIGQFLMLAEKQAVQNREVGNLRKTAIKECADNIRALQMQSEQLKGVKLRLYEKYTSGSITREEYLRQKTSTDAKIADNEEAIRRGHERMQELDSEQSCSDERLDAVCKEYRKSEALTYELAHAVIRGGEKKPERKIKLYPLKGLVCCGNCKRTMTRRKLSNGSVFYQCHHSTHDHDTECPVGERYSEITLEAVAFNAIGQFLMLAEKQAVQNREVGNLRKTAIKECADSIRTLQMQSEQLKGVKLRLYEKYTSGSITREDYLRQKTSTDAKIADNEEAIRRGHERMQELDSEQSCSDERLDEVCKEYRKSEALTYELAHAFISAMYIHDQDNIEIVWKFGDIFDGAEISKVVP